MINRKSEQTIQTTATEVTEAVEHASRQLNEGSEYSVKFTVKINDKIIESDLDKSLHLPTVEKLNPTYITNMLSELPSLHARWNFLYNEAVYEYDTKKIKLDVWIAKKSQEYRKTLSRDGKVTEKMLEETVLSDPEYEQLNDELSLAKKNMKHILTQANGFGDKGEKLIYICSLLKWEGENLIGGNKYKNSHIKKKIEYSSDMSRNDGWPTAKEE